MKRPICLCILVFSASSDLAAQEAIQESKPPKSPSVIGKWQSDREKTMEFNETNTKLTEKQLAFLRQLCAQTNLEFSATHYTIKMPAISIDANGSSTEIKAFDESFPYTAIGSTEWVVAIKTKSEFNDKVDTIRLWHFDDGDTMWTYVGDTPFGRFHIREYYRRVD